MFGPAKWEKLETKASRSVPSSDMNAHGTPRHEIEVSQVAPHAGGSGAPPQRSSRMHGSSVCSLSLSPPAPAESDRIKQAYIDDCEPTHAVMLLEETHRRRYSAILEALRTLEVQSLLDLGCGEGNLEQQMARSSLSLGRLVGCDLSLAKLKRVNRATIPSASVGLLQADAEQLPLRPHAVDAVVATEVVEHVPDEAQALSELARLAARRYVITVPALHYPPFILALGSERVQRWAKSVPPQARGLLRAVHRAARWSEIPLLPLFLANGILRARHLEYYDYRLYHGNVPHRLYTARYLVRTLRSHGLEVETIRGVGFSLPYLSELEIVARWRGLTRLALTCAHIQARLDERFVRAPDASQNIMVIARPRTGASDAGSTPERYA